MSTVLDALKNINTVPHIWGSVLLSERQIVARDLPKIWGNENLVKVVGLLVDSHIAVVKCGFVPKSIELEFNSIFVIIYFLPQNRHLLLFAQTEVNRGFLKVSANMTLTTLETAPLPSTLPTPVLQELPINVLEQLTRELAFFIGPVAKKLLRKSYAEWQVKDPPENTQGFINALALHIDSPADQNHFQDKAAAQLNHPPLRR